MTEWQRSRHLPLIGSIEMRVHAFSSGDRVLFYFFAAVVGVTALISLYGLQKALLVSVPAYGGTIVEGEVGSPRFINPLLAISDADRDLVALTYAGLMGIAGDGSLVHVLAESHTIADDGKTYTFTLRGNAQFSDGSPVTANDIVYTIQKAQDPALKSPQFANWSGVSVTAVDQRTVRFTLSKPYAPFLGLTTIGIVPARLWQSISDEEFPFSNLQTNPVGAGPFKVTGVQRDASGLIRSVRLANNSSYALGRPYLDGLTFKFYSRNEDLATAVANGDVDSAHDVPGNSSFKVMTAPYARVFGVFWNPNEKQVYSRIEVRKALSLAVDRRELIQIVLGGYATPILGPVPPGGSITPAAVPTIENPTAAAADELRTHGWKYDSDTRIWSHAGSKQTLESITIRTSNVPELKNVATRVKNDWEKLGIPVDIELYEPGDLSQNVIRPRKYEALLYGMVVGRDVDLYPFWSSQERNDPGLNIALYANKTVDALLEEVRGTGDVAKRNENLEKIDETISEEYPAAFLYASDFMYAIPHDLKGVLLPQIISPADRFASAASWYRSTDAVWPFLAHR
jgi:peptide/nickel transport system substrate-binding protein